MSPSRQMFCVLVAMLLVVSPAMSATWTCDTFSEIRSAMFNADPYDVIEIMPGNYHVSNSLYVTTPNLVIKGMGNSREDVVLYGNGMNVDSGVTEGIWTAANGIELHNMTFSDFWHHGIHITGTDDIVISNVKTLNCGERHIKGAGGYSENVLIDNLLMEQTEEYLPRPGHSVDPNNYIGGIDAMHVDGWTIRNSTAKNIRGATGHGRAAIFLWNGVSDVTIENNTIIDCGHGISIGNPSGPNGSHVDPYHAIGGVISNNVILRRNTAYNWAFELDNVKDFEVVNNTIYSDEANFFRLVQIYDETYEGTTENLVFKNNILRGGVLDLSTGDWSASAIAAMGNIVDSSGTVITPDWFVDPDNGDFHLTDQAIEALGAGVLDGLAVVDMDGQVRGVVGAQCDMGADQRVFPGDVDMDGDVDSVDLAEFGLAWNPEGTDLAWSDGNFDIDGDVDSDDLAALGLNWNPAGQDVPEPFSAAVMMAGLAGLLRRRKQ